MKLKLLSLIGAALAAAVTTSFAGVPAIPAPIPAPPVMGLNMGGTDTGIAPLYHSAGSGPRLFFGPITINGKHFDVWTYLVNIPLPGAADYDQVTTNLVHLLYVNKNLAFATNNVDVGFHLQPGNFSQTNHITAVFYRIAGRTTNDFLSLNQLRFNSTSSDTDAGHPNGYLASTFAPAGLTNPIYSARSLGVIWNGAERVADTLLYFNSGDSMVNEIDGVGLFLPFFQTDTAGASAYMNQFSYNYSIPTSTAATNGLIAGVQNNVGLGLRMMRLRGDIAQPSMNTPIVAGTQIGIGANMELGNSGVLFSTRFPNTPRQSWTPVCTVNPGEVVNGPMSPYEFFFVAEQPVIQ